MDAREELLVVLDENGLRQGGEFHSWRCDHPARYGTCECMESLADAIVPIIEQVKAEAKAEALEEAAREIEDTLVIHRRTLGMSTQQWLTDRAAAIRAASETEGGDHE